MKPTERRGLKAILQQEPESPSVPNLSPRERLANQTTVSQSTTNSSHPPEKRNSQPILSTQPLQYSSFVFQSLSNQKSLQLRLNHLHRLTESDSSVLSADFEANHHPQLLFLRSLMSARVLFYAAGSRNMQPRVPHLRARSHVAAHYPRLPYLCPYRPLPLHLAFHRSQIVQSTLKLSPFAVNKLDAFRRAIQGLPLNSAASSSSAIDIQVKNTLSIPGCRSVSEPGRSPAAPDSL